MTTYINSTDITDTIAKKFVDNQDLRVSVWLSRANSEIEALALSHDVYPSSIITSPLNPVIADYGRSVFCRDCFLDNIGTNNVETPENEKYLMKFKLYSERVMELSQQITPEMFDTTASSLSAASVTGGGIFWRG
jgi:hypothetical protein